MKKHGWQSLGRVLLLSITILALLSLSFVNVFAQESATDIVDCTHVDVKSAAGTSAVIGYDSATMTFSIYENENFFSTFISSNAKLYESIVYGDTTVTAEAAELTEGKAYRLGFADIFGNMVYFSGEVTEYGALCATEDIDLAASVVAVSEGDGYVLGIETEAGVRYLALSKDAYGVYTFSLSESVKEIHSGDAPEGELRSCFIYDGETVSAVFTRFVGDNICDDCGADLPGISDGELTALITVISVVVLLVAAFVIIRAIIRRKSVNYLFDNNGFR